MRSIAISGSKFKRPSDSSSERILCRRLHAERLILESAPLVIQFWKEKVEKESQQKTETKIERVSSTHGRQRIVKNYWKNGRVAEDVLLRCLWNERESPQALWEKGRGVTNSKLLSDQLYFFSTYVYFRSTELRDLSVPFCQKKISLQRCLYMKIIFFVA